MAPLVRPLLQGVPPPIHTSTGATTMPVPEANPLLAPASISTTPADSAAVTPRAAWARGRSGSPLREGAACGRLGSEVWAGSPARSVLVRGKR